MHRKIVDRNWSRRNPYIRRLELALYYIQKDGPYASSQTEYFARVTTFYACISYKGANDAVMEAFFFFRRATGRRYRKTKTIAT